MEELMTMLHTIFPDKEVYDLFITTCSNLETSKIVYFFGEGSNGKSTICRLLQLSFGDIFSKISSKLLEKPISNRDFQRYRDKKILCTELNQEKINLQCLKELRYNRTLIIHSCRPPSFPEEILQRTIIIPFRHYFSVDDPQLPKKLPQFVKPFVELLRENGSSLTYKENTKMYDNLDRTLQYACKHGFIDVINLLLANGADPTAFENEAIRLACSDGRANAVEVLLQDGRADPKHALAFACVNGHTKVVSLLLQDGRVDPTENNEYAIRFAANDKIKERLIAYKYRVDGKECCQAVDSIKN